VCVRSETTRHSPEGLNDEGGDGGTPLVSVGLPGQRDAVLGHVRDYGLVRRTRQLEGLRGLGDRRVGALWSAREEAKMNIKIKRLIVPSASLRADFLKATTILASHKNYVVLTNQHGANSQITAFCQSGLLLHLIPVFVFSPSRSLCSEALCAACLV